MSSFVNSSQNLYPRIFASDTFEAEFGGEMRGHVRTVNGLDFRARFAGEMRGHARLALETPEPILNEIAENAFENQHYAARLLDNDNNEIDITSFSISAPKGAIGKLVDLQIAKKDLSLVTLAKTYTFQIGKRPTARGAIEWETIIENAELDSRAFSIAWSTSAPSDTLSFGAISAIADKLNLYPASNIIIYDGNKISVSIDDLERVFDSNGARVETDLRNIYGLNLYYLLNYLRKLTGFASIQTNIPNFEISRADFPITNSFRSSIAGIIGAFEPIFFTVGSDLWILDKTAAIPEEFAPRAITADQFLNWQVQMPSGPALDGFLLSFIDSSTQANTYVDRLVQTSEETGRFGDANYTRTEIARTYRDWKNTGDLNTILKSEIIREVHSTYNNLLHLTGREIETHTFDAQGKRTNSRRTVEALVPDLQNTGTPSLLTTRDESQSIFYTPEPKNPKRFLQSKIITQVRGLISIDAANQYFEDNFKQDFIEAHKAGNLTVDMTSEFAPLKTITETLTPLGNNQYQVRISTFDHLRNTNVNSTSEPKTGDATLNGLAGRSRQLLVLHTGLTQATRTGRPIETFAVGELPLFFAKPLAQRLLARRLAKKQTGAIEIAGFDSSVERGVFFRALDRNGASFGIYLAEGYSVSGTNLGTPNQRITTRIDSTEI